MRYVLDFGSAQAGAPTPTWSLFIRLDTLAAVAQPTIHEISGGQWYFDLDWSLTTATSITFKVSKGGIELSDTLSSPDVELPGATTASAGVSSLVGYSQVGPLIARAGTQVGVLNLNPVDQATYDPFAVTDPNVVQLLEFMNVVGEDLVSKASGHLRREVTFVTAASQTSWALPADFVSVIGDTAWDRTGVSPLYGSVSGQQTAALKGYISTPITNIPYRIQGNRLVFPVAPPNGLTIALEYVSEYWIQTAASGTGPDADHATASTDYVLFDPTLVIMGLKCRFLEAKGKDTSLAYTAFADRLEWFQGKVGGSRTLSMSGWDSQQGEFNIPDTGYGIP
jgi:hypothetical protein